MTPTRAQLAALLQNLGGEARLKELLEQFYRRMSDDLMIGFFFQGKDLTAISAKQGEFLLRAMGARASYSGKPPAQAHEKLPPILRGHFDRRLRLLEETLASNGVTAEDIRIWVAFEETFRSAVEHS
jgi:truncated hemoglobin YjbI